MTRRQGKRRRKLLDDLKKRRGYPYLKEEALDRTMWSARFGRGFGPVVRQTTELDERCTVPKHLRHHELCFFYKMVLSVGG